jgi:hypothetical protein
MKTEISPSHVIRAFCEYARNLDATSFNAATDLYAAWGKTVESEERLRLCQAMNDAIVAREGEGFEALLHFIAVDPDLQVVANAALKLAGLYPGCDTDPLQGARIVARLTKVHKDVGRNGAILGGLILLGDERLTPLIYDVWNELPPESRTEAVSRRSPFVFRAQVLLLIDLLEQEVNECVYQATARTLGNLALKAQKCGVIDAERVFPAWRASGDPLVVREHFSRAEFASEILDRLDQLCEAEPGGEKVMPLVGLLWKGFGE